MTRKALTLGSAVIDIIVTIDPGRIEQMQMRNADTSFLLVEEGRKVDAESITRHIGGGGVNTAVSLARLGFDTASLVKTGNDRNREDVTTRLAEEGVSLDHVLADETQPTGSSVLVSSHDRNAGIFTARGANTTLKPSDIAPAAFERDLVFVSGLSNESAACFPHVIATASAAGARVAVNPGIRQLSSRGSEFFACLDKIDLLTLNRVEAEQLVPTLIARGIADQRRAITVTDDPSSLHQRGLMAGGFSLPFDSWVRAIISLGTGMVLITNGADGAYVGTGDFDLALYRAVGEGGRNGGGGRCICLNVRRADRMRRTGRGGNQGGNLQRRFSGRTSRYPDRPAHPRSTGAACAQVRRATGRHPLANRLNC